MESGGFKLQKCLRSLLFWNIWGFVLDIYDAALSLTLRAGCSPSVKRREQCFCGDGCQRFERQMTTFWLSSLSAKMTIADPVQVAMIFVKQKKAWASLVPRSP